MPTVMHRLADWADETPGAIAQRYKSGSEWKEITAREYCDGMYHLALFLESKGIGAADAGAILAYNSPEWVHMDLATLLLRAKSAGLYPNSTAKDIHYILGHTGAKVLAVQNKEYFRKITGEKNETPLPDHVHTVIVFDGDVSVHPRAIGYTDAVAQGRKIAESGKARTLKQLLDGVRPREDAFLIYTSGTTGNPKGALLSHDNLVYTSDIVTRYWRLPYASGTMFSFLPLCHIAEKLQSVGVGISQRYTVSYCSKFENVASELVEVQPTLLLCVPRLWEKMMEGVLNKVERGSGAKKKLAVWALAVGARVAEAKYAGRMANPLDLVQLRLADKLVLSKVRHALGLGKAELLASGAAALPPHVSRWFRSLGLEILEDYGQTETTGVVSMTEPGVESAGTVGKALPGTEMKLAEDGEILSRGRHIFLGYFKNEEATRSTLLEGGWVATGDLGEFNDKGQLKIRGRKKEIMKTSGGKMVAPVPIEERLKAAPVISQVCMVGDGRKYLAALITLSEARLAELKSKPGAVGPDDVVKDEAVIAEVKAHVDELNRDLAQYEQIKRFAVIGREFSIVDGEMTPTMKMKRNIIEKRFATVIESLYA